ncbi:MAG TPA: hypothetical protein ENN16_00520, partial [Candidatus Omnitrophica bacterium]|nr:hypothetical protein [Candidatus Omnitrophota bacterium]
MEFLLYSFITITVLLASYRIRLKKALLLSVFVSALILAARSGLFPHGTFIFLLFINTIPFIVERFKKDFNAHKDALRSDLDEVKREYEGLIKNDRQEIESNLEKDKKLQQVLALYEISKDMSACLVFEDIFAIFSATLKKSFRFRTARMIILKDNGEIGAVYRVEIGRRSDISVPDDF